MSPRRRAPRRLPARSSGWKRSHPSARVGRRISRPRLYVEPVEHPDDDPYAAAYARAYSGAAGTAVAEVDEDVEEPEDLDEEVVEDEPLDEDRAPEPGSAHRPRPRRRGRVVLLAVVVLGLLVTVALAAVLHWRGRDSRDQPLERTSTDARVFATLPRDGSLVRTRVLPDGDLRVTEWIRSRRPLDALTLAPPEVPGLDPGRVAARGIVVRAGTARSDGPGALTRGATGRYPLAGDAREVRVSYVLTGVVEVSSRSTGRALARVVGLDVGYTGATDGSRTVTVAGSSVLALACLAERSGAEPQPCGRPLTAARPSAWTVRFAPGRADQTVMAQVQLR